MNLQFLFPNWLWASSLILIPIIIHLFNFRKYKLVYFTNVHLLQEVKKDTQARTKLKEWLILLSRILFILFFVFAFAQPIWVDKDKEQAYSKDSDLIIVIDNSFSMSAEGKEGSLLESAKIKALDIVNAYPSNTRTMILSSDVQGQQIAFKTQEESYSSISQIKISAFTYSLDKVVSLIRNRVTDKKVQHHVYLLSDFQKKNYSAKQVSDTSFKFFLLPIQSPIIKNISVDTSYFLSPIHNLHEDEVLVYKVSNRGNKSIVDFNVELYINDSLKAISSIDIASGESILDTFNYKNESIGINRGRLSLSDFPMTFDNDLYFNYTIKKNLKVGIYSDTGFDTYLEAFFKNNTYYKMSFFNPKDINIKDWENSDIIILNTKNEISSGLLGQIKAHIENDKPLVVFANNVDVNTSLWNYLSVNMQLNDSLDKQIQYVNYESDVFKNAFKRIENQLALPKICNVNYINGNYEWLLKTKQQKAVVASSVNNRVMLLGIPMNANNKAFYTHPILIPLMYNFMSDASKTPIYYDSGEEKTLFVDYNISSKDNILNIRKGEEPIIPEQYSLNSGVKILIPNKLEAGYYPIDYKEKQVGGFSVNYNRNESETEFRTRADLDVSLFTNSQIEVLNTDKLSSNSIAQNISYKIDLWYYSILLALLFLILEIFLIIFWRK